MSKVSSGMNLRKTFVTNILLSLVFASFSVHAGSTHESIDRDSLLAFKSKISNDSLGILNSWNDSTHFCNWTGVTCGRRHRSRVTVLNLQSQKLEGTLSPHVGNLSFLRELRLANNSFSLDIPQELGALSRLETLYLDNNFLSGEIPPNLSHCSNLYYLDLSYNELGGNLPSELGVLSNLQTLALGSNNFSGPIPTFNISSLTKLRLSQNKLNGSIPIDIGLTLPKLEVLSLFQNQLSGAIPISISNLTSLQSFDIGINRFTGKVPYLGTLQHLNDLRIDKNSLGNGEKDDLNFISSLLNSTNLKILGLNDNNFGGIIPELLSNFSTKLNWLNLGRNKIRGRIPIEIGNLINLELLGIDSNLLSGAIPSSIGQLHSLYDLASGRNKLSGQIPSSMGNLYLLGQLDLSENNLQGSIPPNMGGCISLTLLYLDQNNLSGSIPKELFNISSSIFLYLSENILTGSLPLEVGKLANLNQLDVSKNNLSGDIPQNLGGCTSLEILYLDGNSFHGEVPSSLGALRGLQYLDLSRNKLSGYVPNYLQKFSLLYLNLSWNDFEGRLPDQGVFSNLTAFSATGNRKLCGGITELNLPSCTSRKFIPSKLNLIVSLVCVIVGMISVSVFIFIYMSRRKRKFSMKSNSLTVTSFSIVSYDDLLKATNGFSSSNLIGVGGFGSVYKGVLGEERSLVAVKVLDLAKKGATKSFMVECEALRSIRHRNLVKIITACSNVDFKGNDFKALVYEFVINGSLDDWLHTIYINESGEQKYLSFVQRFNIVVDVANALDYMHNECQTPIVHCDLKPSNILIDEDMVARVGDFGLARLCHEASHQFSSTQSSSLGIKGSIGYAAPEYGMGSEVSTYGDVYSFGILMLETFCGKRPTDDMFKDGLDLHNFARMALPERVMFIADPTQFQNVDQFRSDKFWECFISIVRIGVACSLESPGERMNMKKVLEELVHIKDNLLRTGVHLVDLEGIIGEERSLVAVKVLDLGKKGATKSFMAECEALRSIRHRNLVKIITACSSVDFKGNDFKALVYEFMINGSLEDWLHPVRINESIEQKYLSFVQRFNIVLDVANALDYMHNECQTPIVHCDLKPSNILIDKDMVARVGDFGLARLCPEASHQFSSTQSSSLGIKGSIGYVAPEYGMGSEVSTFGDAYSFGILLLETFTGKRPTDSMFNDGLDLHNFAKMSLPERVMFIVDPLQFQSDDQFRNDKFWECFISVVRIGVACSLESPRERMNIKKVTEELVHIKDDFLRTGYILSFHPTDVEG